MGDSRNEFSPSSLYYYYYYYYNVIFCVIFSVILLLLLSFLHNVKKIKVFYFTNNKKKGRFFAKFKTEEGKVKQLIPKVNDITEEPKTFSTIILR